MRECSEYVQGKITEWKEKYSFPEYMDFQLQTLFELQEQYQNTTAEHVKTKSDILAMIRQTQQDFDPNWLQFNYNHIWKTEYENKKDILIIVHNKEQKDALYETLVALNVENIKHKFNFDSDNFKNNSSLNSATIETESCKHITIIIKDVMEDVIDKYDSVYDLTNEVNID